MAGKRKLRSSPKTPGDQASPRNAVQVALRDASDRPEDAVAQTLIKPSVQAAATIQKLEGGNHEVNALARELSAQIESVRRGDLSRAEGMLVAQAHTLDELFNNLARRAASNVGEYINAAETYFRLALKAQSQCRATLETLAFIKNPAPVAFVRQANIAAGPQQVNNTTMPANEPSRAREMESEQSKLSGVGSELLQDGRASAATGGVDRQMATMGTRPARRRRKAKRRFRAMPSRAERERCCVSCAGYCTLKTSDGRSSSVS